MLFAYDVAEVSRASGDRRRSGMRQDRADERREIRPKEIQGAAPPLRVWEVEVSDQADATRMKSCWSRSRRTARDGATSRGS